MKIAITGHTSGIGKALYKKLSPNCIGFSKSNGYDISKKTDRLKIIKNSIDCDIFINNAYSDDFSQIEMLLDIWKECRDCNKQIINIGSDVVEYNISTTHKLLNYRTHKMSLKMLCKDLLELSSNLKIDYTSFGYVGTDHILKKYPDMHPSMYITIDQAVEIIIGKLQ